MLVSCLVAAGTVIFYKKITGKVQTSGAVTVNDGILTLSGPNARMVVTKGNYKNFTLEMELRTVGSAKGEVWFHTDTALSRGYRVAINNDSRDSTWWRTTGSLLSVRNVTKDFVRDGEWFTMTVKVSGKAVDVDINGTPVVRYVEPAKPYRIGENVAAILSEGTFAFTSTSTVGEIQFRKITVTVPKKDDKPIDTNEQSAQAVDEQTDPIIRLHQDDFPVLDYHVHLKGGLTKENAIAQSRKTGINYVIAPNCGVGFSLSTDTMVGDYLDSMRTQSFMLAMQAEGREWVTTFSPEMRERFDFVFTDALTFTDDKGRRTRLWIPQETWIENEQQYMDMLLDRICGVLTEPADVYVNPCFLPAPMDQRSDELWTEARMTRFITALAASGKAIEINELYQIPSKAILMKAKEAGVKFTFGTNNVIPEVSDLPYSLRMKEELGLKASDMYNPKSKKR